MADIVVQFAADPAAFRFLGRDELCGQMLQLQVSLVEGRFNSFLRGDIADHADHQRSGAMICCNMDTLTCPHMIEPSLRKKRFSIR